MAPLRPDGPPDNSEMDRLRLAAIVESSDDAIISKDLDGTLRSWNPAAERIFGYNADEMIGATIFKLIPPELHEEERGILRRIAAGEHIAHFETDRVRKDGRRIRVSLTLSPLRDSAGHLIGASSIKRDVTAQRNLETQLNRAQRMETVGRLAGGIAHDFNNLLTIIGGLTALTLRRLPEASVERRNLDEVAKATERASALTEQLLTFGRRHIAQAEVVVPNVAVQEMETLLRRLVGEHVTLHTRLPAGVGQVRVNRVQLEQVVMNLVLNARDAMPEGGDLTIATENAQASSAFSQEQLRLEPGEYVVISVSDTGVGMDAVTQASIFEPFFTTKPPGEGTGLGLATVYAIVQQAGGAIYVYSEPAHGSVFKVYLPRVDAVKPASDAAGSLVGASAPAGPRQTVLLVEDEPALRAFVGQVLESGGYEVIPTGNGDEALAAVVGRSVSLLLTDVVMPGMSGRALAERLTALQPGVPVLFMSGYTDDMVLRTGVIAEGDAFIQKPFSPDQLLDRVHTLLHKPSNARSSCP
ncbi:MAG TPA: PAS domain S-box protein [Gemmatimonadales bacterium]|nr:PAS domain S-box protein [Gemmatimonadales bacterium]